MEVIEELAVPRLLNMQCGRTEDFWEELLCGRVGGNMPPPPTPPRAITYKAGPGSRGWTFAGFNSLKLQPRWILMGLYLYLLGSWMYRPACPGKARRDDGESLVHM